MGGFTSKYWVGRLVYYEKHVDGTSAGRREYLLKRWRRAWKIDLIEGSNPTWADLFGKLMHESGYVW